MPAPAMESSLCSAHKGSVEVSEVGSTIGGKATSSRSFVCRIHFARPLLAIFVIWPAIPVVVSLMWAFWPLGRLLRP
jgi:hypothetical protein